MLYNIGRKIIKFYELRTDVAGFLRKGRINLLVFTFLSECGHQPPGFYLSAR